MNQHFSQNLFPRPGVDMDSLKKVLTVVYLLQALSFFVGITLLIGVIVDYVKQDDAFGTWLHSHFRWQIRTFWYSLLWTIIGLATIIILIGWVILTLAAIWLIYRIIKGWIYLNDGKPLYTQLN